MLDAKLARRVKDEALLQLPLYSDLLAQTQGVEPELMHPALGGGGSKSSASFRVAEYAAYYRAALGALRLPVSPRLDGIVARTSRRSSASRAAEKSGNSN